MYTDSFTLYYLSYVPEIGTILILSPSRVSWKMNLDDQSGGVVEGIIYLYCLNSSGDTG
jgi:hypothetical protein